VSGAEKCDKGFRNRPESIAKSVFQSWTKAGWELSNEGVITNYTVVNYNDKHLPRSAPYILALIKVDGADTPFPHIVEGIDVEDVGVGMKVKAVFAGETTNTIRDLDHFEPV